MVHSGLTAHAEYLQVFSLLRFTLPNTVKILARNTNGPGDYFLGTRDQVQDTNSVVTFESTATPIAQCVPLEDATSGVTIIHFKSGQQGFFVFPAPNVVPETQEKYYEPTNTWSGGSVNPRSNTFSGSTIVEQREERGVDQVRTRSQLHAMRSRLIPLSEARFPHLK